MLCGSVCVCMSQAVNVDSHKQSFVEACEVHLTEGDRRLAPGVFEVTAYLTDTHSRRQMLFLLTNSLMPAALQRSRGVTLLRPSVIIENPYTRAYPYMTR